VADAPLRLRRSRARHACARLGEACALTQPTTGLRQECVRIFGVLRDRLDLAGKTLARGGRARLPGSASFDSATDGAEPTVDGGERTPVRSGHRRRPKQRSLRRCGHRAQIVYRLCCQQNGLGAVHVESPCERPTGDVQDRNAPKTGVRSPLAPSAPAKPVLSHSGDDP
jgi:hypothetical protein